MKFNISLSFLITLASCEAFTNHVNLDASLMSIGSNTALQASLFGFGEITSSSSSSSKSKALIAKAKNIVEQKSGFYSDFDEDVFAEDFVFRGPYIGPLNKKDYLETMDAFKIYEAFPDINPNTWGFSIDPENSNRVWFMVRNSGTFTGEPMLPGLLNYKANGAKLNGCPETFSITFDEEEKMKYLSVGYVADRFEGNTDGKGAAIGILNVIGLPVPKVGPVLQLVQWFGSEVYRQPPLSYSTDVPEWWTNQDKSTEGYL